ncbi:MAG: Cache 3/Cache 2 fusion domain-containing protein [Planctomycetota bacterium]
MLDEELADEAMAMARNESALAAKSVLLLVRSQGDFYNRRLSADFNVANNFLKRAGKVSLGSEKVRWEAVNQDTNQSTEVELPQFLIDGKWIGQNRDAAISSPVVDDVRELVGGACTLFQRMNDAGDMIRVSTNVVVEGKGRALVPIYRLRSLVENPIPSSRVFWRGCHTWGALVLKTLFWATISPFWTRTRR